MERQKENPLTDTLTEDRRLLIEKSALKHEEVRKALMVAIQILALLFLMIGVVTLIILVTTPYHAYDDKGSNLCAQLMCPSFAIANFLEALFCLGYLIFYRKPIWFLGLVPSLTLTAFFGLGWYLLFIFY